MTTIDVTGGASVEFEVTVQERHGAALDEGAVQLSLTPDWDECSGARPANSWQTPSRTVQVAADTVLAAIVVGAGVAPGVYRVRARVTDGSRKYDVDPNDATVKVI